MNLTYEMWLEMLRERSEKKEMKTDKEEEAKQMALLTDEEINQITVPQGSHGPTKP